jgi:hypothetical protein
VTKALGTLALAFASKEITSTLQAFHLLVPPSPTSIFLLDFHLNENLKLSMNTFS